MRTPMTMPAPRRLRPRRAVTAAVAASIWVGLATVSGGARGQTAQPPAGTAAPPSAPQPSVTSAPTAPSAASPPGVAAAGAPETPGIGPSGGRIGSAEVTIVGGNVASARERALAEALKQSVDQELATLAPQARAAQPKIVVQVLGNARRYVRRYRTLEEGETGRGLYGIRVEAEVDDAALLRAFDRPAGTTTGPTGAASGLGAAYFVVGAGAPEAALATARAFVASGMRALAAPAGLNDPSRATEAAARAGIPTVAFVTGTATAEGEVRGPGLQSVSCTVGVRLLTSGAGLPIADDSETVRSFADRVETARADCFARASGAVVPRVVPVASGRTTPDARAIVIDADVIEPGAVAAMLKQLREIAAVSAVEVRRISAGRAELWVRSRDDANALAAVLARDTGGAVAMSPTEVAGDLVRVRARLRDTADAARPLGVAPPPPTGTSAVPPVPQRPGAP